MSASIFFFFLRNSSDSSPPGPNKHLAAHSSAWLSPKNPAAAPAPSRGFSRPPPSAGPGDLIVLKHSSYRLIFQCPLSLVSNLHICWNTVGCSLCSSDQIGVSVVLSGSGLCSHLSLRHLPDPPSLATINSKTCPSVHLTMSSNSFIHSYICFLQLML